MASDTAPAPPSETRFLRGARVHCRPSEGQEVQRCGQQLSTTQSLWKCDSRRTKGCPVNLKHKQRVERNSKGRPDELSLQCSLSCGRRLPHYLPNWWSSGRDRVQSPAGQLCPRSQQPQWAYRLLVDNTRSYYFLTSTPNTNLSSLI